MSQSHWIDPERIFDSVVVTTTDAVYVCNPPEERAKAIVSAIEAGEPASQVVLKDDPTTILFAGIEKVRFDQLDDDIDIDFKLGKSNESKNITFSNREERDAFAAELTEHLPGFTSETVEWGRVRAAFGPVVFGSIVSFFTFVFHAAARAMAAGAEADATGRRAGVKRLVMWAIELVGPIGVLVVGGLVLSLTAAYLFKRLKTPPIMTTLKPGR